MQLDADHFFKAMESVLNGHNDGEESTSEMDFGTSLLYFPVNIFLESIENL